MTMLVTFGIDDVTHPEPNKIEPTHRTDHAVSAIKHEGVELSQLQGDSLVDVAAQRLASGLVFTSMGLDDAEVKHRFGFAV